MPFMYPCQILRCVFNWCIRDRTLMKSQLHLGIQTEVREAKCSDTNWLQNLFPNLISMSFWHFVFALVTTTRELAEELIDKVAWLLGCLLDERSNLVWGSDNGLWRKCLYSGPANCRDIGALPERVIFPEGCFEVAYQPETPCPLGVSLNVWKPFSRVKEMWWLWHQESHLYNLLLMRHSYICTQALCKVNELYLVCSLKRYQDVKDQISFPLHL